MLAVGLMSGTSADGVTAARVRIGPGRAIRVLAHRTFPFTPAEQRRIHALSSAAAPELSEANAWLGRRFAAAARRLLAPGVRVIGSHGQTVWHEPGRHTLQIGEPSIIAEETGVDVVADFRPRDVAAGGQGAPLVPFFDDWLFGGRRRRALLNLGGIANVTVVGGGRPLVAFDTGPANVLLDEAVRIASGGRETFDRGGRRARRGNIDARLLAALLDHPWFAKAPPKSTGRELFNADYLRERAGRMLRSRPDDVAATCVAATAVSVADALQRHVPGRVDEVIVSGGGALNPALLQHLSWTCFPAAVRPSGVYGLPPMAKEAAAFALFAARALEGRVNTLPRATGARRAVVAGKIVPGRPR